MIKIERSEDCGNSPKNKLVEDTVYVFSNAKGMAIQEITSYVIARA